MESKSIKKFSGSDYDVWEMSFKALLTVNKIAYIIDPKAVVSKKKGKQSTQSTKTKPDTTEEADDDTSSIEEDQQIAYAFLVLSLDEKHKRKIAHTKTVLEALQVLRDEYQSKSTANKMLLRKKFSSFRMAEGTTMANHIAAFDQLILSMTALGLNTPEEDAILQLLMSLDGTEYDTTVKTLSAIPSITLAQIKQSLLTEETQRKMSEIAPTNSAFMAMRKDKGKGRQSYGEKYCQNCKKNNHSTNDCWFTNSPRGSNRDNKPNDRNSDKNQDKKSVF